MAPFLRKLLLVVAAFAVVFALGYRLGGREDAGRAAEPAPRGRTVTVAAPTTARETRPAEAQPAPTTAEALAVSNIVDGDTLDLTDGRRVRLVQIDTPELRGSECYAEEASIHLSNLVPPGTEVEIELDPSLDQVDRYGRQLGYILRGGENVNLTLVRDGAASVWFYRGARGKYAAELEAAAAEAQAQRRGLWGACPGTVYDPFSGVATAAAAAAPTPAAAPAAAPVAGGDGSARCDANYEGACVPPYEDGGDVDCAAVGSAVTVVGSDPHRLDGNDNDGLGCESYG